jgi:FlaA1/EpsC-like NDP-sugar epimerase
MTNFAKVKNSPAGRMVFFLVFYTTGLTVSLLLAYLLRFDFEVDEKQWINLQHVVVWLIPCQLGCLYLFRQFHVLPSYFSVPGLLNIIWAATSGTGIALFMRYVVGRFMEAPPRGVILLDYFFTVMCLTGMRLTLRWWREAAWSRVHVQSGETKLVAIIGAGDAGVTLAHELRMKRGLGLRPIAFFDDDESKWNLLVHDIPVYGKPELLLEPRFKNLEIDEAIIAMPSAPSKRLREVVQVLSLAHLKFETVPSLEQLATGQVKMTQLRPVEIEDLLGRDPIHLQTDHIRQLIVSQRVLVTGAGGSIGSELCRQIAAYNPRELILVERSEVQLFQIQQELIELGFGELIVPLVADVLDQPRMQWIFQQSKPQLVFHAAAHKHVPIMEDQPDEAIRNNSLGTARLAELSGSMGVDRFVFISTDKAINPTSVMGATKRLAEIFIQSLFANRPTGTKFMAVRFGNVLGSSGSVIPVFKRQIAAGGPVKVTDPEITRYFMTIPEAVGLVLQSCTQGSGGEIFVLDMGKPVKILDLARQLIELSGYRPDIDIEIQFVGLRPGEKLYEELSYSAEYHAPTAHPKIMRFSAAPQSLDAVRKRLQYLEAELHQSAETNRLKYLLKRSVPEYQPYLKKTPVVSASSLPSLPSTSSNSSASFVLPAPQSAN